MSASAPESDEKMYACPVEDLFFDEKYYREKATEIQLRRSDKFPSGQIAEEDVNPIYGEADQLKTHADSCAGFLKDNHNGRHDEYKNFIHYLTRSAWDIAKRVGDCWTFGQGDLTHDACKLNQNTAKDFLEHIDWTNEQSLQMFDRRCTHFNWAYLNGEQNSIPAALNDIAACTHIIADWLLGQVPETYRSSKIGLCMIGVEASDEVYRACSIWEQVANSLSDMQEDEDTEALEGKAVDNRLMLRVGSAVNHKTHMDLNSHTLDYYDKDENVNELMSKYYEAYAGLDCHSTWSDTGVNCDELTKENIDKAAIVTTAATSMDIRLSQPEKWWYGVYRTEGPGIKYECKRCGKKFVTWDEVDECPDCESDDLKVEYPDIGSVEEDEKWRRQQIEEKEMSQWIKYFIEKMEKTPFYHVEDLGNEYVEGKYPYKSSRMQ